jgi:hypothetical protein
MADIIKEANLPGKLLPAAGIDGESRKDIIDEI